MPTHILCIGDMHLGRRPTQIPSLIGDLGLSPYQLSAAFAWKEAVSFAIENSVSAVILAGDVVDGQSSHFEAYADIKEGVDRLYAKNITTYAVAGNHDAEALTVLAEKIPHFHLLGKGGQWETLQIGDITLAAWSFPSTRVCYSPLQEGSLPDRGNTPFTFGLLHCDLDVPNSTYAPVKRSELEQSSYDGWLLGHIHKPSVLESSRPIGYLGSLSPMDPSEQGSHGPWLLSTEKQVCSIKQVPLAPLRWEVLRLSVNDIIDASTLRHKITEAVETLHQDLNLEHIKAVGLRIYCEGRSSSWKQLEEEVLRIQSEDLHLLREGVLYFLNKIEARFAPALQLTDLARAEDPPGLLARKLLSLEENSDAGKRIIEKARASLEPIIRDPIWTILPKAAVDDESLRQELLKSAYRALEALLSQTKEREINQ